MILYIDETENEKYFIVVGFLTESKLAVDQSFKHFQNITRRMNIKEKYKGVVFSEYKSYILDRSYRRIKNAMLDEINSLNSKVIYSYYIKKEGAFKQSIKQKIYIHLLENIVKDINEQIDVIFDKFGIAEFEQQIQTKIKKHTHVNSISPMNSHEEPGLKYVDNLCSVIRRYLSRDDQYDFYRQIENIVVEVKCLIK